MAVKPVKSTAFKDHFSEESESYRKFRPTYPTELFAWLASLTSGGIALDCATGNGQTAKGLAGYFGRVLAADASLQQLHNAARLDNIHYLCCLAEYSCCRSSSIDLMTVSQAIHWFDFEAFFLEAKRVLRENGILAFWCYGSSRITPEIDAVVDYFYHSVVGPFWPAERSFIEKGYRTIAMPIEEIEAPSFVMRVRWDLRDLLGYLATWSACRRYRKTKKVDPLGSIREILLTVWGEPNKQREIVWPLFLRVGRKKS